MSSAADPKKLQAVSLGGLTMETVRSAKNILSPVVPRSRLIASPVLSKSSRTSVFLKLECEGPTGSFKLRGAYHAIHQRLAETDGHLPGVVTSSTSNHGAAVAAAASLLNLKCRVFLPLDPNPAKRARIEASGAEITEVGEFLEETRRHAAAFAREAGWFDIVDGIEPSMLPGTATIACEILESLPQADVLFVPVGDSTLIRGFAFAARRLKPQIRIIGVQAERAPAYAQAFRSGHAVSTASSDTIADGLSVRDALEENVRAIAQLVDDFVLVSEEEMLRSIKRLLLEDHVLAEPAGAAAPAALLKAAAEGAAPRNRIDSLRGKSVVCLVSGSNIPEDLLKRALES
jgi:threonine dehydratase